jgi:hypothetical protein
MNQCSLESATHKVSDNHLHHGWQWLAAITPTDSSTPPTMGVDTIWKWSAENFRKTDVQKPASWVSVGSPEATRVSYDVGQHLRDMARENIISKHYKGLCLSSYCKLEEHVTSADLPCSCPNHQLIFKTLKQQVECRYFQKQIWEASIEGSILKFWVNMKGKLWEEEMRILKLKK